MNNWQPIETAPKDGTEVLVWPRDNVIHKSACRVARWNNWADGQCWVAYGSAGPYPMRISPPLHWQPLPDAPL